MPIRESILAGSWYPGDAEGCRCTIESLRPKKLPQDLPDHPVATIVPHAGWAYSGRTAVAALEAIRLRRTPQTFIVFASHHRRLMRTSALYATGAWETPLGPALVDEPLASELLARFPDLLSDDPHAHDQEHSLEIQVPLIRHLFPEARIVPILVGHGADPAAAANAAPAEEAGPAVGRAVGEVIRDTGADAVCLGSTDLTHYGPAYGFAPKGSGPEGLAWMHANDRRMIDLMLALKTEAVRAEADSQQNSCGPGAVAATLAVAKVLGAARGHLVQYTTSYEVTGGKGYIDAAVGYAAVVF
jgi:MEMO1 family protein